MLPSLLPRLSPLRATAALGIALLLCFAAPAHADDSAAAIGVGGITFEKNDKIVMESEQLDLGLSEVRIRFVFRNTGPEDITTVVAFPLPDISMAALFNEPMDLPRKDVNFVGFSVTSNGIAVTPETELAASVDEAAGNSIDVTDILGPYLRRHGPGQFSKDALSKEMLDKAKARGTTLLEEDGSDPYPVWTVHTKFYWTQRFPAGETVVLEHRYQPILGAHYSSFEPDEAQRTAYCPTPETAAEAKRRIAAAAKITRINHKSGAELAFQTRELAYVLVTGANWSGPIKDFKLTIETGDPDMLVASCFPGLARSGPTTLSMSQADYTPDRDIAVAMGRINWSVAEARHGPLTPMDKGFTLSDDAIAAALTLRPPGPYLIQDSNNLALTAAELAIRGSAFLRIARNEIFARRGYVFADKDLAGWFARRSWYHPQPGPVTLSPIEKANVALLEAEAKKRAAK